MKIILLCGNGLSSRFFYNALSTKVDCVIMEDPVSRKNLIKNRIKKLGILHVIDQLIFQTIITTFLKRKYRERIEEIVGKNKLNCSKIPDSKLIRVNSINSEKCISKLLEYEPDIIIVNGTRIISSKVLSAVNVPFVNTHLGITPQYRGVHGAYWAIVNNDFENCGVTVHFVDKGIDTGKIIKQEKIEFDKEKDSFVTYPFLQYAKGISLMKDVLNNFEGYSNKAFSKINASSKLYYHPRASFYIKNTIKGVK